MAEEQPLDRRVEHWVNFGATILAPATVLSAVLFYFGYVSSRAQYEYFGIDVDTIGLSTRDYVMRSPQPLLVPLIVLTLIAIGAMTGHSAVRRRIEEAEDDAPLLRNCRRAHWVGLAMLGAGLLLFLLYTFVRDWPLYPLVTPLLIAVGAAVVAYSGRLRNLLTRPDTAVRHRTSTLALRRTTAILVGVVIAANLFWATATVAQWSGRGLALYRARHLDQLPTVILDTKERLYLTAGCRHPDQPRAPCVDEAALPAAPGQTYRYRYRHLRLLIQGHDRMFLVPDEWSASDSTIVVPLDDSVRVQFQFQNQPP